MHQNVIIKTSLTNMSKSEKVLISVTFLLITFFGAFFQHLFWVLLACYVYFHCKRAQNGSKKQKIFFYECVLEFNYATIKGSA
jgi:hypothetical protein